ncbi:MAG: diguanylate cyclase [Actinobacteria bacterium]|nr:diguanylate cyclase [Actinomycetota bacterium]
MLVIFFTVFYSLKVIIAACNNPEEINDVIKFSAMLILVIITIFILLIFLFRELFIKRIINLKNTVSKIEVENLNDLEINDKTNDEIGSLTLNIKKMLEKINQSRKKVAESEQKYKSLFENSIDGISIRTKEGKFIDVNNSLVKILGYDSKEEVLKLDIPTQIYASMDDFYKVNSMQKNNYIVKIKRKDQNYIWAEVSARIIEDSNNNIYYENIVRNVTDTFKKEEKIKYLSYYDQLTGLYNRAYLEKEIQRLDNKKFLPISVIILDINGLRIINNAFGPKAGDEVLRKIAQYLRISCRQEELISRWGGDEFIIILPDTSEELANKIAQRIKDHCSLLSFNDMTVSISLGINVKSNENENLHEIIIEAEERMNRHKLFEIKSINSSVILSLERALWEKSSETEKHAERLKNLAILIGKKINLSENLIDDLILLASLHDIGKLGISEDILSKKTKLNQSEWEIIKKHPEIGYQIARSSPQLSHIADFILTHHERWDGSGYPKGLKGEEIPLISRIISIVDAFDVMIEGRVYKSPRTINEAIEELKRCSGTQFDPELVEIFIRILEPSIYNNLN